MSALGVVLKKEMVDNLRDRRSLSTSLLSPLFTPFLLIALIFVLGQTLFVDPQEQKMVLPVQGAENAPALIEYLEQQNVEVVAAPEDPATAVREGELDVVVIIPEEYAQSLAKGQPAEVRMVADTSRQSAMASVERTRSILESYNSLVGALRLQARGVDPTILSPLSVRVQDISTPQTQTLLFLGMLPFMLIMNIFMGGMYVIIDTTAGERERGSLEPLLINPVSRAQMVLGKLIASLPFALATLMLTLAVLYLAFQLIPFEEVIGMPMELSLNTVWMILLLSIPLLLFASGIQMLVASFTRSFKEAQTYLGFLPLVAGLPSMFLAFLPVKVSTFKLMIPAYSQALLMDQALRGETMLPGNVMISTLATLLFTAVIILLSIRLYQREQILIGR